MKYIIAAMIGVLLLIPAAAQAQYYQPGGGYGGYGGYGYYGYFSSTAAEGYGRGVADVIRSHGLYNQLSAEAAVRLEVARRLKIENQKKAVETYYQLRDQNKARRAAELAERRYKTLRWLEQRRPVQLARLSESQLDPSSGAIQWPAVLLDDAFAAQRAVLEELFAKRARQGGLYSFDDRQTVEAAKDVLLGKLRERIEDIHPQSYILGKRFIEALGNEVVYTSS